MWGVFSKTQCIRLFAKTASEWEMLEPSPSPHSGSLGFLDGSEVKNLPANGLGGSPGEGDGNPLQYLPGEFQGQRSLAGYSPWGRKESDTTERLTHHLFLDSGSFTKQNLQ